MAGKGSKQRPILDRAKWEDNYHKIFGYKGENRCQECGEVDGAHTVNCNVKPKDYRTIQQDMTELNADGNRTRGRNGEDLDPYEMENPLEGTKPRFWDHHCNLNGYIAIESGHACNWCGMQENGKYD